MHSRLKALEKKLRAGRCPVCNDGGERDVLDFELVPVGAPAPRAPKLRTCEVCGRPLNPYLDLRPPAE